MPQSLSNLLVHIVFSTKERQPFLEDPRLRVAVHRYLASVSDHLGCPTIRVGGVEDHIHLLGRQGRTIAVADWVKELKRTSSLLLKEPEQGVTNFQWQAGYAVFSVSQSHSTVVERYIAQQEEHHRRVGFQGELRRLLTRQAIPFDERYVWD